jgi:glycine/D-amino acid oxidase-like deaminating enzyme
MTSPAMGRLAAALAVGEPIPADLVAAGLAPADILLGRILG